jgi:peptidoglycan hydrolase-like protein with peptidoglycan-binding domain
MGETEEAPEVVPVATSRPMLRKGSKGDDVRLCQRKLSLHGEDLVEDGDFGPRTDSAVRSFQASENLDADGIVGPLTWAALDAGTESTLKPDQGDHQVTGTTTGQGEELLDEVDATIDRLTADTTEFQSYVSAGVLDPQIASTLAHLRDLGGDAQYAYAQAKDSLTDGSMIGMQFQRNRDTMLNRKLGPNDPDTAYFRNATATANGLVFYTNLDQSRSLILVGDSYPMNARSFAIDLAHELNHARNVNNKQLIEADSSEDTASTGLTAPQMTETRQKFVQEMVARHAEWWTAWTLRMDRLQGSTADVPRPTADQLYSACNGLAMSFAGSPIYDPFGYWTTLSTRPDNSFNVQVGAWMRLVKYEVFSGNPYRDMESQALFLDASTHVTANADPVGLGSHID